MQTAIQLFAAFLGSLGFGALFNLHGKKLLLAAIGGFIGWAIYLLIEYLSGSPYISAFLTMSLMTLYSEIMARIMKAPVTVFLVISVIPLVPGAALYRTANNLMMQNFAAASELGTYALLFAASMSAGITLTTLVFQAVRRIMKHVR